MCQCNPSIRTPWCGKGDCVQPKQKISGNFSLREQARQLVTLLSAPPSKMKLFADEPIDRIEFFLGDFLRRKEAFDIRKETLVNKHSKNLEEVLDLCEEDEYYKIVFEPLLQQILKKMNKVQITQDQLEKFERMQRKMNALEAGGVDN